MRNIIKSLGIVFGDIGTSPIYTLTVIFLTLKPTEGNVIAVLRTTLITLYPTLSHLLPNYMPEHGFCQGKIWA